MTEPAFLRCMLFTWAQATKRPRGHFRDRNQILQLLGIENTPLIFHSKRSRICVLLINFYSCSATRVKWIEVIIQPLNSERKFLVSSKLWSRVSWNGLSFRWSVLLALWDTVDVWTAQLSYCLPYTACLQQRQTDRRVRPETAIRYSCSALRTFSHYIVVVGIFHLQLFVGGSLRRRSENMRARVLLHVWLWTFQAVIKKIRRQLSNLGRGSILAFGCECNLYFLWKTSLLCNGNTLGLI